MACIPTPVAPHRTRGRPRRGAPRLTHRRHAWNRPGVHLSKSLSRRSVTLPLVVVALAVVMCGKPAEDPTAPTSSDGGGSQHALDPCGGTCPGGWFCMPPCGPGGWTCQRTGSTCCPVFGGGEVCQPGQTCSHLCPQPACATPTPGWASPASVDAAMPRRGTPVRRRRVFCSRATSVSDGGCRRPRCIRRARGATRGRCASGDGGPAPS
jgi:hypothetical protein